jgi:transcriptional regulator with XRE-family HTH domain
METNEIKRLREAKGWSLEKLADKCAVTRNTIINWETGKTSPKPLIMKAIKEILAR